MYSSLQSGIRRRSSESSDRIRRDSQVSINTQQLPPYNYANASSPTQYSPTNGTHPQAPYTQHRMSRPSTAASLAQPSSISPPLGPPPSPKFNGVSHRSPSYTHREAGSSYYDPTSDRRENQAWNSLRDPKSPIQVQHSRQPSLR